MIETKPCPFCNSSSTRIEQRKGEKFINGLDHPIEQHKWYVRCNKCKARGGIASGKVNLYENRIVTEETRKHFPEWQTTDNELIDKAVELWNRRGGDGIQIDFSLEVDEKYMGD